MITQHIFVVFIAFITILQHYGNNLAICASSPQPKFLSTSLSAIKYHRFILLPEYDATREQHSNFQPEHNATRKQHSNSQSEHNATQ